MADSFPQDAPQEVIPTGYHQPVQLLPQNVSCFEIVEWHLDLLHL